MFDAQIDVESGGKEGYIQIYVILETCVDTDLRAYRGVDTCLIAWNDGNKI